MKTAIKTILIGVVLLIAAGTAFAYPSDNAAVLYYRAFVLLEEPNDAVKKMLRDLQDGNIALNEQIRRYVERNRKVIDEIVSAAEIKNCDWGLDFSQGLELAMPHLAKCRGAAYLLAAESKVFAERGDYRMALERCITIHKMGIHIGKDTLISRLVGIAVGGIAHRCIVDILPEVPKDYEMFHWLSTRLADVSSKSPTMKEATAKEAELDSHSINREGIVYCAEGDPCEITDEQRYIFMKVREGNDIFFDRSRDYFLRVMARIQNAFDLPYSEAMKAFEDLHKEVVKISEEKPEAKITKFLFPAIGRAYSIETRFKTHTNAVLAAIDIYLIKAKTGKLPDELPVGLPKDMFSGKDFLYEKTGAGFTLKCQAPDLAFDIVRQFEFKTAK